MIAAAIPWWLDTPLPLRAHVLNADAAVSAPTFTIVSGMSQRAIADTLTTAGVDLPPLVLYAFFRLSGQGVKIKAGSYELALGTTPRSLLSMMVEGRQTLLAVTLIEGWNFQQVRTALAGAEGLKPDTQALTADAIMERLERPGIAAEGRFFPDTYRYAKGASDVSVLRAALLAMEKNLDAAWLLKSVDSPLKTPQEVLILASIIEKETGRSEDRSKVASVFVNRLRLGMLLQTDPTVIYGMGDAFNGNLRKKDLQTDTPWNTYTRQGLPPTPIAMPGKASLLAAVNPVHTDALYFVAKGNGESHFSSSLLEHNRAVNRYQRGR